MYTTDIGIKINDKRYIFCKRTTMDAKFIAGRWYEFDGIFGDPQGSLEAGEEHMSSKYFNYIVVVTDEGIGHLFPWEGRDTDYVAPSWADHIKEEFFQDHFIIEKKSLKVLV